MIPKVIHCCWFGGGEKSPLAERCMRSWSLLTQNGFVLREWGEHNVDLSATPVIDRALREGRYAFVSDYVRLKVLYEQGGLYLDTDVEVLRDFSELLDCGLLLGMIYRSSIGTAVIGSRPGHPLVGELIRCYETAASPEPGAANRYFVFADYREYAGRIVNNNDLFTLHFLKQVPGFRLGDGRQTLGDIHIHPVHCFEGETFRRGRHFSRHYGEGSWLGESAGGGAGSLKHLLKREIPFTRVLWDKVYRTRHEKKLPFRHFDNTDGGVSP